VLIGAFVFWCIGVSSHHLMQRADPNRDVALLDGAFLLFGLPMGVCMCVVVYAIRRVWRWGRSRKPDAAALQGATAGGGQGEEEEAKGLSGTTCV
jgi:hypothetical protein